MIVQSGLLLVEMSMTLFFDDSCLIIVVIIN